MKKTLLLFICVIIQLQLAVAQNSVGVSIGYGLPSGSQLLDSRYTAISTTTTRTTQEDGVYGSYGSGLVISGSYGHSFSKVIGIDATVQYLMGKKYEGGSTNSFSGSSSISNTSSYAQGFFFNPSLVLTMDREGIKPYVKAGVSVGQVMISYDIDNFTSPSSSSSSQVKREIKGGVPFGITGAMGITIPLADRLDFFSEINFTSMSYYPTKIDITKYTVSGVDKLSTLSDDQKHGTYKKEITTSNTSPSTTTQILNQSFPLGSVRLNVGVKMNFGKM